jgi:hypothetical protein
VILLSLLCVVFDESLDVGLDDADLGEDLFGGGGPDERLRVGQAVSDIASAAPVVGCTESAAGP